MHIIDLTYVERGIHEELVAYVADQQDYHQQEKVHVAIRDGRAWDRERLRRTATIGLGRAVLSRLTDATRGRCCASTPTGRCSGCSPATPTPRPRN
jgi:NitT/TauT family transport system substrate-binding protein